MTDPANAKAEQLLADAAQLPSPGQIRDLADRALAHGGTQEMSLDEIRDLADKAVAGAEQVTILLRRLSDLLAPPPAAGGEP